jgi:hypothetical protein
MSGWIWEYLKCDFVRWQEPEWLAFYPTFTTPYQAEMDNDNEFMVIHGAPF